jgi:uncharacterized protein
MNLDDAPESSNVEDSRGSMGPKVALGGGAGVLLLILGLVFGVDFTGKMPGQRVGGPANGNQAQQGGDAKTLEFTKKVLGATEVVWTEQFEKMDKRYRKPHLRLFSEQVSTKCGVAPSAVGPFYCPGDETVYLDPTFFDELQNKLHGSKADFSKAYVIAHEVGHHVQKLLGYSQLVDAKRGTSRENDYSVRLELQADYLAGAWAYHADKKFHLLEKGDRESAIQTANAIGDDRLQQRSGGFVHPERFTHGRSAQRVRNFEEGLRTGDVSKKRLDRFYEVPTAEDL